MQHGNILLRGRELGHSLGSLRDSMLGKFTREHETDRSLDLTGRKGGLLVVSGKLSSLASNALEDVINERIHNAHSAPGDAGVRVHLLQDLVDIGRVGFGALLPALGVAARGLGGGLAGLAGRRRRN